MNPSAGYINAPSRQASNLSAFVEPGQPDWFVGRNAPIKAPEFRRSRLHGRAGLAPRVASVSDDCVTLCFDEELPARRLSQDSMTCHQPESNSARDRKVLVIPDWMLREKLVAESPR
jgi:hypothetical protein